MPAAYHEGGRAPFMTRDRTPGAGLGRSVRSGAFARVMTLAMALVLPWSVAVESQAADPLRRLVEGWPTLSDIADTGGTPVRFATENPFTFQDLAASRRAGGPLAAVADEKTLAVGHLFMPPEASVQSPAPAVVLLHGAGGVLSGREITYARQLSEMGIAALVVDVFGGRPRWDKGYPERLIYITEAMAIADAYAALGYLAAMPEIDPHRIALVGFSYGGMSTLYAAQSQVADLYAEGLGMDRGEAGAVRFHAHVSFYAPCISRFADKGTTGAPILMMWGDKDELIDTERCLQAAEDLRAGGSHVQVAVFDGAYHQWDGNSTTPFRVRRGLADCRFHVRESGRVAGQLKGMPIWVPMVNAFTRKMILLSCSDDRGYWIVRDDAVRNRSNGVLGRFLWEVFSQSIPSSH